MRRDFACGRGGGGGEHSWLGTGGGPCTIGAGLQARLGRRGEQSASGRTRHEPRAIRGNSIDTWVPPASRAAALSSKGARPPAAQLGRQSASPACSGYCEVMGGGGAERRGAGRQSPALFPPLRRGSLEPPVPPSTWYTDRGSGSSQWSPRTHSWVPPFPCQLQGHSAFAVGRAAGEQETSGRA